QPPHPEAPGRSAPVQGFTPLQRYFGARLARRTADRRRADVPPKGLPMMIRGRSAYVSVLLIVAGCAPAAPPPAPAPTPVVTNDTSERSFDEAVNVATDALVAQLQKAPGPSVKTQARRGVVIDPMVDVVSGQQTATTHLLEQRVAERLASSHSHVVVDNIAREVERRIHITGERSSMRRD